MKQTRFIPRTAIRRWMFEAVIFVLCVVYFLLVGRTRFGSRSDPVIALLALTSFLIFAWERHSEFVRRHDMYSS